METWLGLVRAVHYGAAASLFGLGLFRQYAPGVAWSRPWALWLSLAALISALAWYALVTANLSGGLGFSDLAAVGLKTSFGVVWLGRIVALLALVALCALKSPPARAERTLSGLVLISIALTGHTQVHEDWRRFVHMASDALHLAAAGAWLGGLIGLARLLSPRATPASCAGLAATVERFSTVARAAVALLVISGLVNAYMLIGRYDHLLASQYIRQLLVKLAFVAGMLAMAAINRFALTPRLKGSGAARAVSALRRNVLIEQALGIGVLLSVGWLGLSDPP